MKEKPAGTSPLRTQPHDSAGGETRTVPVSALKEIRGLQTSLGVAVGLMLGSGSEETVDAAFLIKPVLDRLCAITSENRFPE